MFLKNISITESLTEPYLKAPVPCRTCLQNSVCGPCLPTSHHTDAEIFHNRIDHTRNQKDLKVKNIKTTCLINWICSFSGQGGGKGDGHLVTYFSKNQYIYQDKSKTMSSVWSGWGTMTSSISGNGGVRQRNRCHHRKSHEVPENEKMKPEALSGKWERSHRKKNKKKMFPFSTTTGSEQISSQERSLIPAASQV